MLRAAGQLNGRQSPGARQLFDAARVEMRQRVTYTPARNQPVRRDFGERHQHEGAGEELRMRQRQLWIFQSQVLVSDEVDVDLSGAPPAFLRTLAPKRPLHRLCASQKCTRSKTRLNGDARV